MYVCRKVQNNVLTIYALVVQIDHVCSAVEILSVQIVCHFDFIRFIYRLCYAFRYTVCLGA